MFTGLIESVGRVAAAADSGGGRRLRIETPLSAELRPGDSIAVNGVCLTVTGQQSGAFLADVSPVTMRVTSLGGVDEGGLVNLERPLRADARLGGHFVLGHVDGVGTIATLRADGDSHWLEVEVPAALEPYLIPRGSVAVDGISLTVASLVAGRMGIQIVPFTLAHTTLGSARPGDTVNLEGDVLGKYVARLVASDLTGAAAFVPPKTP
jgi:riboflavin synthase